MGIESCVIIVIYINLKDIWWMCSGYVHPWYLSLFLHFAIHFTVSLYRPNASTSVGTLKQHFFRGRPLEQAHFSPLRKMRATSSLSNTARYTASWNSVMEQYTTYRETETERERERGREGSELQHRRENHLRLFVSEGVATFPAEERDSTFK